MLHLPSGLPSQLEPEPMLDGLTRRRVDGALDPLAPIEPPVQLD